MFNFMSHKVELVRSSVSGIGSHSENVLQFVSPPPNSFSEALLFDLNRVRSITVAHAQFDAIKADVLVPTSSLPKPKKSGSTGARLLQGVVNTSPVLLL